MIRFHNDYNHGGHPAILRELEETNTQSFDSYGLDAYCRKAEQSILKYLNSPKSKVHFLVGGTQANFTLIASALRPYQSVLCADTGHINCHETGAVENSGHKVQALPNTDGKITAAQVAAEAEAYRISTIPEHITQPKMVYISFPTEMGTIYSKKELADIYSVCREYGLYLFVDGARLSYGLAAETNDITLADLAALSDAFYCGGTKCGALFGEALVLNNPALQTDFRSYIKQNGAMLAKGWLLGLQFDVLFRDGLYFKIGRQAVGYAMQIKKAFAEKGLHFLLNSDTNQQFVILSKKQQEFLAGKYTFEFESKIDDDHDCVRFCTSWYTTQEEVDELLGDIRILP